MMVFYYNGRIYFLKAAFNRAPLVRFHYACRAMLRK